MKVDLGIVHAPIWEGQAKTGVAFGPTELEKRGLYQVFFDNGFSYKVFKPKDEMKTVLTLKESRFEEKPVHTAQDYDEYLEAKYKNIHDLMLDAFDESKLPILLGGDHSCAISSISALLKKYPKAGIIWIDAHADINTFDTSPTGNIHGMPVAALSGMISKQDLFSGNWTCDFLNPKQIVYLGIRDLDPGEQQVLKEMDILAYSAEDMKKIPLKKIFDTIETHFDSFGFNQGVHVSFDIDGLSSDLVPSTGTPVGDGIELDTLEDMMKEITHYFDLTSIDCVEFNPKKTKNEDDILRTYKSIEIFFRTLLLNPSFMVDRHVFKKIQ